MTIVRSYEVHARERQNWRIEALFAEQLMAIDEAKCLIGGNVNAVRVIEETFDPEINKCVSKVVYTDTTTPKTPLTKAPPRDVQKVLAAPAPVPKKKDFAKRLALLVFACGSAGIGIIVALAYLLDALR